MGALMADEETGEFYELQDNESWEERTLNLLHNSKIDQGFTQKNGRKRKHKISLMKKRPMVIPSVILELQNQLFRESSLRCLSNFLLEKREEDPENYERTGYLLYDSCSTMAILLQEVLVFSQLMADESLTVRASKRLINVLTLFQCIAANKETRKKFVKSFVPNFLVPVILFESSVEIFENVRAVALSVIGILCQAREPYIIRWAIQSEIMQACLISIEIGDELCKVIGMHIVEAILQEGLGISYVCKPSCDCLLFKLMMTLEHLVDLLAPEQDFSPRLLFHVIRCYFLLCNHARGFKKVMERLPNQITNGSFDDIAKEFPVIGSLLQQLLLTVSITNDRADFSSQWFLQLYCSKDG